jgi:hypothetical protein
MLRRSPECVEEPSLLWYVPCLGAYVILYSSLLNSSTVQTYAPKLVTCHFRWYHIPTTVQFNGRKREDTLLFFCRENCHDCNDTVLLQPEKVMTNFSSHPAMIIDHHHFFFLPFFPSQHLSDQSAAGTAPPVDCLRFFSDSCLRFQR